MPMLNPQPISLEEVGPLLVQPVARESVAITTSTSVNTDGFTFRVPVVQADPTAAFVAEGAEIPVSNATLAEITVTPAKCAGLTIVSRELAEDSSPAAAQVVGDGLARDIARKIDAAWFGNALAPAPAGLGALSGFQAVSAGSTAGGTVYNSLDAFAEAISKAEAVGATITSFVTDPATALTLAKLRTSSGSNETLLGRDATEAGQRRIFGVDLVVSPAVSAGVVWAYDSSRVWTVLRSDATIDVDTSVFFTSDRVAIRGTVRIGFAFAHPAGVIRIAAIA